MTTSAVPDEIRERVAETLAEHYTDDFSTTHWWCACGATFPVGMDDPGIEHHQADAVLAALDRDALIAMLGACPTDATESVALPRDTSGESPGNLVTRLRDAADLSANGGGNWFQLVHRCREAADEIERLAERRQTRPEDRP